MSVSKIVIDPVAVVAFIKMKTSIDEVLADDSRVDLNEELQHTSVSVSFIGLISFWNLFMKAGCQICYYYKCI